MRDAAGFAPPDVQEKMTRRTALGPALLAAALLAAAAWYVVPRGIEANTLLSIEDDPARIAAHALDGKFDAAIFRNGIWFAQGSTQGTIVTSFGQSGDRPIPNRP